MFLSWDSLNLQHNNQHVVYFLSETDIMQSLYKKQPVGKEIN